MSFRIIGNTPLKGFFLRGEIIFNGHLCILTGKNGAGKTRLLESIQSSYSNTYFNEVKVSASEIETLSLRSAHNNVLDNYSDNSQVQSLARSLFEIIKQRNVFTSIPESIPIRLNAGDSMGGAINYNVNNIIKRTEKLLQKKAEDIIYEELELALCINRELFNGRTSFFSQSCNLSELTKNYYYIIKANRYLSFLKNENNEPSWITYEKLIDIIGKDDPSVVFNEVISKVFRGKFRISPPISEIAHYKYEPQLILNSSNEVIKIEDLSSGEKIAFWMAAKTFDIVFSNPEQIFGRKKIILIDEPDTHLHPQMIVDFYESLNILHKELNIIFIFTTHSPTTVALSPTEYIFNLTYSLEDNVYQAQKISKDGAVSQLLEGVTQISINPDNSRQVYVENTNDYHIYEKWYTPIKNNSEKIDPNISLSFLSAGPKIADSELEKHIRSVYGEDEKITLLINKINGEANCHQVIGMVKYLTERGNNTIRGLIDWDKKNRNHGPETIVFAKEYAYSIENIVYDPISIYAYLTSNCYKSANYFFDCDPNEFWSDHLNNQHNMQSIVDKVMYDILGKENDRKVKIAYMNGQVVYGDTIYFIPTEGRNGHDLEKMILEKYHDIHKLTTNKRSSLMFEFTTKVTLALLGWRYLNSIIVDTFAKLQK